MIIKIPYNRIHLCTKVPLTIYTDCVTLNSCSIIFIKKKKVKIACDSSSQIWSMQTGRRNKICFIYLIRCLDKIKKLLIPPFVIEKWSDMIFFPNPELFVHTTENGWLASIFKNFRQIEVHRKLNYKFKKCTFFLFFCKIKIN